MSNYNENTVFNFIADHKKEGKKIVQFQYYQKTFLLINDKNVVIAKFNECNSIDEIYSLTKSLLRGCTLVVLNTDILNKVTGNDDDYTREGRLILHIDEDRIEYNEKEESNEQ